FAPISRCNKCWCATPHFVKAESIFITWKRNWQPEQSLVARLEWRCEPAESKAGTHRITRILAVSCPQHYYSNLATSKSPLRPLPCPGSNLRLTRCAPKQKSSRTHCLRAVPSR